jgi:hypothetical protein
VDIDRITVKKILTADLDMRKVCAEVIPNELIGEQKHRVTIFHYLSQRQDDI